MAIVHDIERYQPFNEQEAVDRALMLRRLAADPHTFDRTSLAHCTASAWVVDPSCTRTLLVHHNIYRSWSWIGGHADGERDLAQVAQRELAEETGVHRVALVPCGPGGIPRLDAMQRAAERDVNGTVSGSESIPTESAGTSPIFSLEALTVDGHEKRGAYVGSHLHLNVTYLFVASPNDPIRPKLDENSAVRWVPLEDAVSLLTEPWIRDRIYRKLIAKIERALADQSKPAQ